MNEDLGACFIDLIAIRAGQARARINHCLDQIDTVEVWKAPEGSNSIGIILQHLNGNLKQWVLSALGGQLDTRERNKEFMAARLSPLDDMRASFNQTMDSVIAAYRGLPASRLPDPLVVQGMQHTVMSAMFNTVCHLELHAGQIIVLTKQMAPDRYREFWKPQTKEQGA